MTHIYQACSEYVSSFVWPTWMQGEHLHEIFSAERKDNHRSARHIKAQGSDLLGLVPVLAMFTHSVLLALGECVHECMVFMFLLPAVQWCLPLHTAKTLAQAQ